jgi:pimeloyl-ACP methyl ester carboxylesterase
MPSQPSSCAETGIGGSPESLGPSGVVREARGRLAPSMLPIIGLAVIEEGWDWQSDGVAGVAVSTLLLTGSETPHELSEITSMTAAAISGAHVHVLAGHGHFAHVSDPGLVAQALRDWLE